MTGELFPQWLHEHQVLSLTEQIEREAHQREALVEWMAHIDSDILRWSIERAEHQTLLDHGLFTQPAEATK